MIYNISIISNNILFINRMYDLFNKIPQFVCTTNTFSDTPSTNIALIDYSCEEEFQQFIENNPDIETIFLYSNKTLLYPNRKNIHIICGFKSAYEILKEMEPFLPKHHVVSLSVDSYIRQLINEVCQKEYSSGFRYVSFFLLFAIKNYDIDGSLYMKAFIECRKYYQQDDTTIEKALRDFVMIMYNHFYENLLFFIHYDIDHHKVSNSILMEALMDYTVTNAKYYM